MSLFSGFSTAGDEERAIRLSRLMTERTYLRIATVVRMHSPKTTVFRKGQQVTDEDGEPLRACGECLKPWPCPTWQTLTGED